MVRAVTVATRDSTRPVSIDGAEIGGVIIVGSASIWPLIEAKRMQLVSLELRGGFFHPRHSHPRHEAVGHVISGQLEMEIGGIVYLLGTGDSWYHPVGVEHSTRALEDTLAVEIHAPRRADYSRLFEAGRKAR